MAVALDSPGSAEDLYLERGNPVEPWRPIMTGDVFTGAQIAGCGNHDMIMVLSHPCSLRRGVELVERVQALPVVPYQDVPLTGWAGNYRVMPLPELHEGDRTPHAARLSEFGMVDSGALDLGRRICSLSELGVVLLQQRFFHNQSRVKVGVDRLFETSAPNFTELELWMQWNEELAEPRVFNGEDVQTVLNEEGHAFDQVMRSTLPSGVPLREALLQPVQRNEVRRRVLAAARTRADGA